MGVLCMRRFKWTKEDGDFVLEFPEYNIMVWDNEDNFKSIEGYVSGMEINDGDWDNYPNAFILFDIADQHFDKIIIECIEKVFDGNLIRMIGNCFIHFTADGKTNYAGV